MENDSNSYNHGIVSQNNLELLSPTINSELKRLWDYACQQLLFVRYSYAIVPESVSCNLPFIDHRS